MTARARSLPRDDQRVRTLDALSVLVLLAAVLLWVWPARADSGSPVFTTSASGSVPALPQVQVDTSGDAATIVSANILSGSRHAPARKFAIPEANGFSPAITPMAARDARDMEQASDSTSMANADGPRLFGIVSVGGSKRALLRLGAEDAETALYSEGDRRNGYRVVRIEADRVLVTGPGGQRMLRLARSAPGDSTPQAPPGNSARNPL